MREDATGDAPRVRREMDEVWIVKERRRKREERVFGNNWSDDLTDLS